MEPGHPYAVYPAVERPCAGFGHRYPAEGRKKRGEFSGVERSRQKPVEVLGLAVSVHEGQGSPPGEICPLERGLGAESLQKRLSGFVENIPKHFISSSFSPK